MKRLLALAILLGCALGLNACAVYKLSLLMLPALLTACAPMKAPVIVPSGALYQHTLAPLTVNYHQPKAIPAKSSSATSEFILIPIFPYPSFAFMSGQALNEAMRQGGITTLYYADYEAFNVLGVYRRFTVHAYGE